MNITPQMYSRMTEQASPKSNVKVNVSIAFAVGGGICVIGQIIMSILQNYGLDRISASAWTSIILVTASAICTGFGWYSKLARHAGAGTLVPITGFANAISSSAIEAKSEGFILGVGTKIFTIAGPVILYGLASAVLYGLIYYVFR
ncbi:MAG: SpoVA/SpoVAEb family sporulation membrane protein [Ruminococcus sp.]|nr:SpoVA/SpoVAEb family sporulation membrane protein [Ruminococcus sp.]